MPKQAGSEGMGDRSVAYPGVTPADMEVIEEINQLEDRVGELAELSREELAQRGRISDELHSELVIEVRRFCDLVRKLD